MDSVGVCINEDWTSLCKMFFGDDETDFALQFLESFGAPSNSCRIGETNTNGIVNIANFDEIDNPNFYLSQESYTNYSIDACFPTPSNENQDFIDSNLQSMMNIDIVDLMSFCVTCDEINELPQGFPNDNTMQDVLRLNEEIRHDILVNAASSTHVDLKKKFEVPEQLESPIKTSSKFVERPRKRSRVIRDTPKSKRHAQTKKTQKPIENVNSTEERSYNTCLNGQSSSSCSSEDDSNVSQDLNNVEATALDSNGKSRAVRGAATDPQSLYARKRRERINERLRILQTLVPNGTKVDISTMLEEAVHYVKFLQLQIKLLSSDDMWMYAPIAYNGMDMGLYQKISTAL